MDFTKIAKSILWFEGFSNMLVFGPLIYAFPETIGISPFVPPGTNIDHVSKMCMRWFGGMTATLGGYVLYKAMESEQGSELQQVVLKAFLVGDFLYVGSFTYWCLTMNYWSGANIFNVSYGTILPICRMILLAAIKKPKTN